MSERTIIICISAIIGAVLGNVIGYLIANFPEFRKNYIAKKHKKLVTKTYVPGALCRVTNTLFVATDDCCNNRVDSGSIVMIVGCSSHNNDGTNLYEIVLLHDSKRVMYVSTSPEHYLQEIKE